MQRRAFISTLGIVAVAGLAAPLAAHDGHGVGVVSAETVAALARGGGVDLTLLLTNTGAETVALQGLSCPGAGIVCDPLPIAIAPGTGRLLALQLSFDDMAPGIFAVALDFGDQGHGPVLITPDTV